MMEPFMGQLMLFAFNFAPRGWVKCEGQLLQISQYSALFSLLGTTYGGDGRTTFAVPDLRGRAPIHSGTGAGLSERKMGQKGGVEKVTLNVQQMPAHSHGLSAASIVGDVKSPANNILASSDQTIYRNNGTRPGDVKLNSLSIDSTGGNQPHENMPPYLVMNWCIAATGVFPSRS